MKTWKTVSDVKYAREQLEFHVDRFLTDKGWKQTCKTPGSYWLWTKVIDGKEIMTSKELALSMQGHIEFTENDEQEEE